MRRNVLRAIHELEPGASAVVVARLMFYRKFKDKGHFYYRAQAIFSCVCLKLGGAPGICCKVIIPIRGPMHFWSCSTSQKSHIS